MTMGRLLEGTPVVGTHGSCDVEVRGLSLDSRVVAPGTLFFAVPGENANGTKFIREAVSRGAVGVVAQSEDSKSDRGPFEETRGIALALVPDVRKAVGDLAPAFYGNPSMDMKVVGVTGTNGKTTTAFLIKHLCDAAFLRCGLLGTVRYQIGDEVLVAERTTPDAVTIQHMLHQMRDAGCKSVSMEVSSHAVVQHRVRGVNFDAAVFTNLTRDHLDYHGSMEAYFEAKASFLTGLAGQRFKPGTVVVNIDDPYGEQLLRRLNHLLVPTLTYGSGMRADFRASAVRTEMNGTTFQLDALGKIWLVRSPLIGRFNVMNATAAIASAHAIGVSVRDSVLAMASAPSIPGRMEPVPVKRAFRVFVDYAHTDDALNNALKTLRDLQPRRLITVFGCGGDRDKGKRPRMGSVAEELSDWVIVTSDNPRSESAETIASEILAGMSGDRHEVILDRRDAIRRAVAIAQPRDIVLIAGKGHENTQTAGGKVVPFDDLAIAKAAVEERPLADPH